MSGMFLRHRVVALLGLFHVYDAVDPYQHVFVVGSECDCQNTTYGTHQEFVLP